MYPFLLARLLSVFLTADAGNQCRCRAIHIGKAEGNVRTAKQ
jgi:hypothetical protein